MDEPLVPESRDPARAAAAFVERGGRVAWGFVGLCLAAAIVLTGLAVASAVVLPLFLAVVLAMLFRPATRWLQRHHVPAPLAAGLVVVALVLLSLAFVWMVTVGIVREVDEVKAQLDRAVAELDLDTSVSETVTSSAESVEPTVTTGVVGAVISGIDMLAELIAGIVLGLLILYYLLKDGRSFLRTVERRMLPERAVQLDLLVADSTALMRRYWLGRTVVSAVVAGVVGLAAVAMGLPMVPTLDGGDLRRRLHPLHRCVHRRPARGDRRRRRERPWGRGGHAPRRPRRQPAHREHGRSARDGPDACASTRWSSCWSPRPAASSVV